MTKRREDFPLGSYMNPTPESIAAEVRAEAEVRDEMAREANARYVLLSDRAQGTREAKTDVFAVSDDLERLQARAQEIHDEWSERDGEEVLPLIWVEQGPDFPWRMQSMWTALTNYEDDRFRIVKTDVV